MKNILTNDDILTVKRQVITDNIVHYGACFNEGILAKKFYDSTIEYNILFDDTDRRARYTAVDTDREKVLELDPENYMNILIESMQDHISLELPSMSDVDSIFITGVFDNPVYGENQYNFIIKTLEECFKYTKQNLVFTLKESPTPDFKYSMTYLFTVLINMFDNVIIKKVSEEENNQYIFYISK